MKKFICLGVMGALTGCVGSVVHEETEEEKAAVFPLLQDVPERPPARDVKDTQVVQSQAIDAHGGHRTFHKTWRDKFKVRTDAPSP